MPSTMFRQLYGSERTPVERTPTETLDTAKLDIAALDTAALDTAALDTAALVTAEISGTATISRNEKTSADIISTFAKLQTIQAEVMQLRDESRCERELARSQGYRDGWHAGYEAARAEAATLLLSEEFLLHRLLKRAVEIQTIIIESVIERTAP